jgi:hypothetical protein
MRKLYEFELVDRAGSREKEILETIEAALRLEAKTQGWLPGYSYTVPSSTLIPETNEIRYLIIVYGQT